MKKFPKMVCYWKTCGKEADHVVIHPQMGIDENVNLDRLYCKRHAMHVFLYTAQNMHLEQGDLIAVVQMKIVHTHKEGGWQPEEKVFTEE